MRCPICSYDEKQGTAGNFFQKIEDFVRTKVVEGYAYKETQLFTTLYGCPSCGAVFSTVVFP